MNYNDFLDQRGQRGADSGFKSLFVPDFLFDFQKYVVEWAVRKGRGAVFADCGLGKTAMGLTWAQNVVQKTNKPVLYLTPLAVGAQTVSEAHKFDLEAHQSKNGTLINGVVVANYERLHYFSPSDFAGVVCDESSILKSFSGATKGAVTSFMRQVPYRLLQTATAAPNDYIELGTSSEALGYIGYMDMLNKFFKNDLNNSAQGRMRGEVIKWRLKGHAELPFWRWVCSWAIAIRRPSDLGFDDARFVLPPLQEVEHLIETDNLRDGMLFALPAVGLFEQREERRNTVNERCEKVAELVKTGKPAIVWCHLNEEGELLEKLIPDCVQVSGKDSDDRKEAKLEAFANGSARVLVTKPKIGAWGLNFQHCSHVTFFPSHSFEQYYQAVRRCWRFGQQNAVKVDIVTTEGERGVMANLQRKSDKSDEMFSRLVAEMNNAQSITRAQRGTKNLEVPAWL
jgi:hypothetical protein